MAQLAVYLGSNVDRLVLDRTGLQGRFDFELSWTGGDFQDPDQTSLFTALAESLGLKLEPSRAAIEFLVIDSVEQPAAD